MKRIVLFLHMLLLFLATWSQDTRTVTGRVIDAQTGSPLAGVSVVVKGARQGTQTQIDGSFSLSVPASARTLVFSYIGYAIEEASIANSSNLSVSMGSTGGKKLDEVVVVAYGTMNKKRLTGSVATVEGEELENKPFASFDQMLQGKVPGLQSVSPNGQPGGAQTIRIRGISSITGNNDPLFVVDGVPINSGDFSRATTTSSSLAGINPNDIESVSVLKDAAAASIYGSRAANGVILITTKRGRPGKTKIKIDAEGGISDVAFISDLGKPLTRDEYFDLTTEGLTNAGATPAQTTATLNALGFSNTANEDWFEHVTRQGNSRTLTVSASGGDARTTFYTSLGYFKQEAPVIGSDFSRYSGNINVRNKASSKLTLSMNLTGAYTKQNTPTNGGAFRNPVLSAYFLRPSQNAYNADGTLNFSPTIFNQAYNPIALVQYDRGLFNNIKTISNASVEYNILRNLKFSSKYGIDYINIEEETYWNPFFGDARSTNGRIFNFLTRLTNWVWTSMLDYHHDFLQDNELGLDVQVGYESQKNKTYTITAQGDGLPLTQQVVLPSPGTPTAAAGGRSDRSIVSMFSSLRLNYRAYSLSGSFRRDGASVFGPDRRYGNFWSVGAAWNIDQEAFLANSELINALKLRASYGINGDNRGTGNYDWRATYAFGTGNNYNQQAGSAPNSVGNPDLTWEENKVFNAAVDFAMFNNRFSGTVEYYDRKSVDLLFAVPLSRTSGFNTITANVGEMENKGWEISLSGTPVQTNDFRWDVNFSISLNRNQVIRLPNNNADIRTGNLIRRVGQHVNSVYTRLWAGVDPATGRPLWYTDSTMKTTTSTVPSGRGIIGTTTPKGFGNFSTTLSYKGFTLDAQFYYQYGHLVFDNWGFIMWSDGAFGSLNRIRKQLGRWQNPGDVTDIPIYIYGNTNNSNAESSRWYFEGDYIRLRELTLSYRIPRSITEKIKIEGVIFNVRGSNLWTKAFDDKITFDPEQGFAGTNNLQVLIQRTVSFGVSVTL